MSVLDPVMIQSHELSGPPGAPVVLALGGISATRHLASSDADPSPGWWEHVVGRRRALDTEHFRVLGVDFLDGGTADDGRPAGVVTTHDQADALAALLDALEIRHLHALVGASYGGMVGLAFAERYPERLGRLVAISAAHEPHPMITALRSVQRQIVHLGLDSGRAAEALSVARQLGMTTYRSRREFGERFSPAPTRLTGAGAEFPVEEYLRHHGTRFAATWAPARFLALSLSADLHRVDPSSITTPTLLVAAEDDAVVPGEQVVELAAAMAGPVRIAHIATTTGHDAFLTEPLQVGALVHSALNCPSFP